MEDNVQPTGADGQNSFGYAGCVCVLLSLRGPDQCAPLRAAGCLYTYPKSRNISNNRRDSTDSNLFVRLRLSNTDSISHLNVLCSDRIPNLYTTADGQPYNDVYCTFGNFNAAAHHDRDPASSYEPTPYPNKRWFRPDYRG